MKEIKLTQGSPEWLEWRRSHRMASETPALLGLSPYQSINDVRKAKRGQNAYVTDAMRQGNDQEPLARMWFSDRYEPMRPAVFEDGDYGASLDGITMDLDAILEIKTPYKDARNSERWKSVEDNGTVPPADNAQMQHQMMVTGIKLCYFLVWDAVAQEGIVTTVEADPAMWETIRQAWDGFWPTLGQRDDTAWVKAAASYREAKAIADAAADNAETARKALLALDVGDYSAGGGVTVQKISRAGNINWQAVKKAHLQSVDLEAYRGKASEYYKVEVNHEDR